ncbi:MAG: XTP/dITP diphosphatase [Gemmatimonadetes bacterium]|nr:XTP/dITP diphosphatase [Gemmatimonadota bacterium]
MRRVVVATGNPGKVREFAHALEEAGLEVLGMDALGAVEEVKETGTTFEANARLKAEGYSLATDLPVLADDSGLEVDALDGAPGVLSARYGGPGLDDPGRVEHLLDELRDVPDERRTARFRCVLALAREGRTLATFDGVVEGRITHAPTGENGFGYDPVFFHQPIGRTFAQIPRDRKQQLSHRGQAIRKLLSAIASGEIEP